MKGAGTAPLQLRPNRQGAVAAPNLPTTPDTRTLGQMMAYYKYQTTKIINQQRKTPGIKFWQRNYYEHIIRNERELDTLREYIVNNPKQWEIDQLHPQNPSKW